MAFSLPKELVHGQEEDERPDEPGCDCEVAHPANVQEAPLRKHEVQFRAC
jgi:hypothetical protein